MISLSDIREVGYGAACQVPEAYVFQLRSKIFAKIVEYTEYFY